VSQAAHPPGQLLGRLQANSHRQRGHLLVHKLNDPLKDFQLLQQPRSQLVLELDPSAGLPPTVAATQALAEQKHSPLGRKTQALAPQLIALPAQGSLLLLLGSGHGHH